MSLTLYGRRSKFDEVIVRLKKLNAFFCYVVSAGNETRMRFSPSIVKNTSVTACYLIRETDAVLVNVDSGGKIFIFLIFKDLFIKKLYSL